MLGTSSRTVLHYRRYGGDISSLTSKNRWQTVPDANVVGACYFDILFGKTIPYFYAGFMAGSIFVQKCL